MLDKLNFFYAKIAHVIICNKDYAVVVRSYWAAFCKKVLANMSGRLFVNTSFKSIQRWEIDFWTRKTFPSINRLIQREFMSNRITTKCPKSWWKSFLFKAKVILTFGSYLCLYVAQAVGTGTPINIYSSPFLTLYIWIGSHSFR